MSTVIQILKSYQISRDTIAILPHIDQDKSKKLMSKVYEKTTLYYVACSPVEIIDQSCRYYGSSLSGRKDGTKEITGVSHKSPIAVCTTNQLFFFPTMSYANKLCAWFAHQHVQNIEIQQHNQSLVTLSNGRKLKVPISVASLAKQLHRTAQLRVALDNRYNQTVPRKLQIAESMEINEATSYYKDVTQSDDDDDDDGGNNNNGYFASFK